MSLGGPGLSLIAFLDSSFLSFSGSQRSPDHLPDDPASRADAVLYALMTTLGSIGGVWRYTVARKGGEAFLRRRFHASHIERAMETFRRYGLLSVLVPSILPPPTPFKIFVLAAGVSRVPLWHFVSCYCDRARHPILRRRTPRGLLRQAAGAFLQENAQPIALTLAATFLVCEVGYILWSRRGNRKPSGPRADNPVNP